MARVFLVFGTSVKGGVEHRRADPIRQRRSTGKPAEKSVAVSQQVRGFKRIQAFRPAMKARSAICAVLPAMMSSPTRFIVSACRLAFRNVIAKLRRARRMAEQTDDVVGSV